MHLVYQEKVWHSSQRKKSQQKVSNIKSTGFASLKLILNLSGGVLRAGWHESTTLVHSTQTESSEARLQWFCHATQTAATRNISDHNALHSEIILPTAYSIVAEISMTLTFSYVMIHSSIHWYLDILFTLH